jgi:hypothetical protein
MDNKSNIDEQGCFKNPANLERTIDSWESQLNSDRQFTRFYLQLRYARPTSIALTGTTIQAPGLMDAFMSATRQIGYNVAAEVTDACTAKICQRLRPRVIPVAAKPDIARACTLYNRLLDGVVERCNFLEEATQGWEDGYCAPAGFTLFEANQESHEITARRTDPMSWFWNRDEGRFPMYLGHYEAISPEVLVSQYPDHEEAIMHAQPWRPASVIGVDPPSATEPRTIRVNYIWRRRDGENDGRFLVTVGHTALNGDKQLALEGEEVGEVWPYDFFPVSVFRNRWDYKGFGGVPMLRYIAPHHLALNRLARTVEESLKGAMPYISSHQDSKVRELSDVPFGVMKWAGAIEPKIVPNNPVSEQALRQIEYHEMKSYAIAGVNKALGNGMKPAGLNSGVALREFIDLAEARMNEYQKHWESAWQQAGHIIVALASQLKKVRTTSRDANAELMEEINVGDLKLDRNDYRVTYGLTSALSKTPSGLLADLDEFKNVGLIDREDLAQAIGDKVPDIQASTDRITSPRRLAAKAVQVALETGDIPENLIPSAMQGQAGLDAIIMFGSQAWCSAQITPDRYSSEGMEALLRLVKCAKAKKGQPVPAVAPVMPAAPVPQNAVMPAGVPTPPVPQVPPQPAM